MQKWEYKYIQRDVSRSMGVMSVKYLESVTTDSDQLGLSGWELVSVTPLAGGGGFTAQILLSFKRPLISFKRPLEEGK